MAEHADMKAHQSTYAGVMNFLKYGTVVCFVIAAGVVWLIAN